jgi:hypothetical protein
MEFSCPSRNHWAWLWGILDAHDGEQCYPLSPYASSDISFQSQPFVDPLHSAVLTKSIPIVALWSIIPWLVDCVLLIRVISVYPPRPGKVLPFIAIITLPIVLKIARLCLTSLFLVSYSHEVHTANLNIGGGSEAEILSDAHSKLPKGDWVLQLVDNAYMSGLFLSRLRLGFKDRVKTGHWDSLTAKLRTLFWIAASNFVIPGS